MGQIDFAKVNVQYTAGNGQIRTLRGVTAKAACDPLRGGWYYDVNPPAAVRPPRCSPAQRPAPAARRPKGQVDIVLGCRTVAMPQDTFIFGGFHGAGLHAREYLIWEPSRVPMPSRDGTAAAKPPPSPRDSNTGNQEYCETRPPFVCLIALSALRVLPAARAGEPCGTVCVDTARPVNSFLPALALGAGVDRLAPKSADVNLAPDKLKEVLSAGWGTVTLPPEHRAARARPGTGTPRGPGASGGPRLLRRRAAPAPSPSALVRLRPAAPRASPATRGPRTRASRA